MRVLPTLVIGAAMVVVATNPAWAPEPAALTQPQGPTGRTGAVVVPTGETVEEMRQRMRREKELTRLKKNCPGPGCNYQRLQTLKGIKPKQDSTTKNVMTPGVLSGSDAGLRKHGPSATGSPGRGGAAPSKLNVR
jgi:hypothetical protein